MNRPEPPPILLGEVRALGMKLTVRCVLCPRAGEIDPAALSYDDAVSLEQLARQVRCTRCNRRGGGMGVSPDWRVWVRHLRATGQEHREPYFACFIRDE